MNFQGNTNFLFYYFINYYGLVSSVTLTRDMLYVWDKHNCCDSYKNISKVLLSPKILNELCQEVRGLLQ